MFPIGDDNPTRRTPGVTLTMIAVNFFVFLQVKARAPVVGSILGTAAFVLLLGILGNLLVLEYPAGLLRLHPVHIDFPRHVKRL